MKFGRFAGGMLGVALAMTMAGCRIADGGAESARAQTAEEHAAAPASQVGIDWSQLSMSDLDVASVFLAARDVGLRPALDSLAKLAARDSAIHANGHQIAHAVGRFAEARGGPAVFAQCTPGMQSGCMHGVMEAYLETAPIDTAALGRLCDEIRRPDGPRLEYRECAHGLGHGIAMRLNGDLPAALAACEALRAPDGRGECFDGVFMQNVVDGLSVATVNVGEAAGHQHGGGHAHGGAAAPKRRWLKDDDLAFPCDSVAARHQASCWSYQYNVIRMRHGGDLAATLRDCDTAPAAARPDCYRGTGKQIGAEAANPAQAATWCRAASAELAGRCIAGAAEYFVDLDWTTPPAHAFCAAVPADLQPDCYGMIGERLKLIYAAPAPIRADCAKAGAHAAACLRGAGLPDDRR
ncbi:MAG TPA: hypothetical protein VFQ39_04340, partial [Longimicrobium sp.]|nr:hypothetical protein [Longimicrobium sp.]